MAGKKSPPPWYGKVRGHIKDADTRFKNDARQRAEAEAAPQSVILTKKQVQSGEWDASRVLFTTLGGQARPITAEDLAAFRRNISLTQKYFKGAGITARQVLDMAHSNPLGYENPANPAMKSDLDKAKKEITRAIAVSAYSDSIRFVTNAGPDSKNTRHFVVVQFTGYSEAANKLAATTKADTKAPRQVAQWLRKGKLKIECTCERWRYFFRYVATIGGFAAGRQERGYPKIRNPKLRGVACKHVLRVMNELENSNVVLGFLEKHMRELQLAEDIKAITKASEQEAAEAAKKSRGKAIKSSDQIKAEKQLVKERRAAKIAATKAPRSKKAKKPAATVKVEKAIATGKISEAEIAVFKKFGMSDDQIAAVLKGKK